MPSDLIILKSLVFYHGESLIQLNLISLLAVGLPYSHMPFQTSKEKDLTEEKFYIF